MMKPTLYLRPAGWWDAIFLWRVRNHQSTRSQMAQIGRIGLLEHLRWYARARKAPDRIALYVLCSNHQRLGYGRLSSLHTWQAEASIAIAQRYRGRGYGAVLVGLLWQEACKHGVEEVRADIRRDNLRSLRSFKAVGFTAQPDSDRESKSQYLILRKACL